MRQITSWSTLSTGVATDSRNGPSKPLSAVRAEGSPRTGSKPETSVARGHDLPKRPTQSPENPRLGARYEAPGCLALERRNGQVENTGGPRPPPASTTPRDVWAAGGQRHSPGGRRGASCGLTDGGMRPTRAASEQAHGQREARSHTGSEKPPCGSQKGCHGSAVPSRLHVPPEGQGEHVTSGSPGAGETKSGACQT